MALFLFFLEAEVAEDAAAEDDNGEEGEPSAWDTLFDTVSDVLFGSDDGDDDDEEGSSSSTPKQEL